MSKFLDEIKQRLKKSGENIEEFVETVDELSTTDELIIHNKKIVNPCGEITFTDNAIGRSNLIYVSGNNSINAISLTDLNKERHEEIIEHLTALEERLLILQNNIEKHEKYSALKDLYDQYKMIEALIGQDDEN